MEGDLYYQMPRKRLGHAVIINNLDREQLPTRRDVSSMAAVLQAIGFDVEIHRNLTSQGMNLVKRKVTEEKLHREANCFLMLVISHGTADNFLLDCEGNKTWNIESLVTEVCDVQVLVGKPKLFFIEACRGKENNFSMKLMSKDKCVPAPCGITLPSKQDVFVGFATVPGFVSFTSTDGSPYLQALAKELAEHHATTDLSDIHLLVKRKLAMTRLGEEGVRQGAEERSSLLSKLLFARYQGRCQGTVSEKGRIKAPFSFLSLSLPGSRSSSPAPPIRPHPLAAPQRPLSAFLPTPPPPPAQQASPASPAPHTSVSRSLSFPSSALVNRPSPVSRKAEEERRGVQGQEEQRRVQVQEEQRRVQNVTHVIEVKSSEVEAGLNELLDKVKEVYGGEGKVKVKKKNKQKVYSFKYTGPERGAHLLEGAIRNVKELQGKSELWKFTQTLEVSHITN